MLKHPDKRKTWGVKSKSGFYLGTSLEHYHYYWAYMPDTRAIRPGGILLSVRGGISVVQLTTDDNTKHHE